jgi:NADH-quinone oxidoreductase subunit L
VPTNPANGEVEDTDVGFPGPDHVIAERALPMRVAMSVLAAARDRSAASSAIPNTTRWLDNFLAPTFADSTLAQPPLQRPALLRPDPRHRGLAGRIATPTFVWVAKPALAPAIAARARPLTTLFENKWYFDELIDAVVVRPGAWFGRFAQNTFERVSSTALLIGGTTGLVRAGSALVRATQSGILRSTPA